MCDGVRAVFAGTPLLQWLETVLGGPGAGGRESGGSRKSGGGTFATTTKGARPRHVCLLLDDLLELLPLEAALPELLGASEAQSVSRDFSLQTLVARLGNARRQQKTPGAPPVTSALRAVVDAKDEAPDEVVAAFRKMGTPAAGAGGAAAGGGALLSGAWQAVVGRDQHTPSAGELGHTLATATGLVFFGPEALLGQLPPAGVVSLDARRCQIAVVLDRGVNEVSNRRQLKQDSTKSRVRARRPCRAVPCGRWWW